MKIVELTIDLLDELTGFDGIALVNTPAIEAGFHAFKDNDVEDAIAFQMIKQAFEDVRKEEEYEFESFNDYPESATNAAKRALKWRDEHPDNDCGTRVGWARANQLANRERISEETIARMASFARHLQHKDVPYSEGCGGLMVDAWGGQGGIEWASNKLEDIREGLSQDFSLFEDLPEVTQDKLIERLREMGISIKSLQDKGHTILSEEEYNSQQFALPTKSSANPNRPTSDTSGNYKILYQYTGPKDSKNRSFCRRLLDLDMLFRLEDINRLTITGANSEEFGYYNIFEFKGSFGCRHRWNKKYVYESKSDRGALEVAGLLLDENRKRVEDITFNKTEYKFATDQDHQIVVGPIMIPDKLIFRVDENNEPYYVFFGKDTIVDLANKMMKNKILDTINLEHDPNSPVEGYMLENWIITDETYDKSKAYGFDLPVGTWMGMYKIENPEVWEMVKQGKVSGFSLEGIFSDRVIQN